MPPELALNGFGMGGGLVRTVARDVERVDLGGHRAIDDADCVHVGYVPVGELAVGAACEQLALVGVVHDGFEEVGRLSDFSHHADITLTA